MAALRAAVFPLSAKNRRGGHFLPPSSARVKNGKEFSYDLSEPLPTSIMHIVRK